MVMQETDVLRAITWEAPEHHHVERSADWYWALGILAIAGAVASILFNDTLFAVVILLAASTVVLLSHRHPKLMEFGVSLRGVKVGSKIHPYTTLESFYIDDDHPREPQILIKSKQTFMPLIIFPIPEEYIREIEELMISKIPEEQLEEPLGHRILEYFGF